MMFKRLLISAAIVLLGAGAILLYSWRQATQLPEWYTESAANSAPSQPQGAASAPLAQDSERDRVSLPPAQGADDRATQPLPATAEAKIAAQVQQVPKGQAVKVVLAPAEVTQIFSAAMQQKVAASSLAPAVKGVNTTLQDQTIASGAVVNLAAVPIAQLPEQERSVIANLSQAFPELAKQDVYIGVEGSPIVVNGQVQLGDDTRIKIGNLSLTPSQLAQRLGVSEDQIRRQMQLVVQLGNLKASDVQMAADGVVVQGAAE